MRLCLEMLPGEFYEKGQIFKKVHISLSKHILVILAWAQNNRIKDTAESRGLYRLFKYKYCIYISYYYIIYIVNYNITTIIAIFYIFVCHFIPISTDYLCK